MTQNLIYLNNFNFLNNLLIKIVSIIEFITSSLISFLNNFGYEVLIIISIIYLASRAQKVLDTATKVVTISTGSTVLYNNWIKGESSDSNNDDDENKNDKNKKNENKEDTNKEDKSVNQNDSNEK